jgi:hypothetical protein
MPYADFLNAAIDDALESVRMLESAPRRIHFREGAIAGLEACRGQDPLGLDAVLRDATQERQRLMRPGAADPAALAAYWHARSKEAQIEWICNVVHAYKALAGGPVDPRVTQRGAAAAARILDVSLGEP